PEHSPFSGVVGVVAALSMITGRENDARLAEKLSGLAPGEVVVDIGCGPGAAVRRAARLGATAIGVDPAPVMLRTARLLTRATSAASYCQGTAQAGAVARPPAPGRGARPAGPHRRCSARRPR